MKVPQQYLKSGCQLWSDLVTSDIEIRHPPRQRVLNEFLQEIVKACEQDFQLPVSRGELEHSQRQSPEYGALYEYIVRGACLVEKRLFARIRQQAEEFAMIDGVLCHLGYDALGNVAPRPVLLSPLTERVVDLLHNSPELHHMGTTKLYSTVRRMLNCPNAFTVVGDLVASCPVCICKSKPSSDMSGFDFFKELTDPVRRRPIQRVSGNLKTLTASSSGARYALVLVDHFSGFIMSSCLENRDGRSHPEGILGAF